MESELVRLTPHPTDAHIVIIHIPHRHNDLMARYEPARLSVELHGYLLHTDHLDSFERFAAYAGLYVIDERTKTPGQLERGLLCDVCCKPRQACQIAAGNVGSL